jgi:hypothetical protein
VPGSEVVVHGASDGVRPVMGCSVSRQLARFLPEELTGPLLGLREREDSQAVWVAMVIRSAERLIVLAARLIA